MASPSDVAIDRSVTPNRLYVADTENSRVLGWSDADGFATGAPADLVIGQPDFASSDCAAPECREPLLPRAVAVDEFGNLYVADTTTTGCSSTTRRLRPTRSPTWSSARTATSRAATATRRPRCLCNPIAVELDVATNLYVIDAGNERVLVYAKPILFEDTTPTSSSRRAARQ